MRVRIHAAVLTATLLLSTLSVSAGVFKEGEKLSLEMEGAPLTTVLNMIAQQYALNLVLSGDVDGKVSVRLEDVDVETALEAILYPNGYNYYLKNDIIVVKPVEFDAVGELTSEVVTLRYADPITAKNALESLKSTKGKVVVLDKTTEKASGRSDERYAANRLIMTDYVSVIDDMLSLLEQIDKPERMVSIEVKIIETNIDSQKKLGLSWPATVTTSLGGGQLSAATTTQTTTEDLTLANVAGSWNPNTGSWTWGLLSVQQVDAVLNMLEQSGQSKLVSDPHVTTLENHEAVIEVQTVIPIPTVTRFSEAAATQDIQTFFDEEVGISLVVTPRINEDGRITMDVEPVVEDIIGFTGPVEAQAPIKISRSIRTRITVDDGQTAALGGLLKEDIIEEKQKVPLLGSIPLLGRLFTSTSKEKWTTDLIIMITPRIIQQ
ncbi:MAG: hypothetical protein JSW34_11405 [Candidatus Zixiibacteriota bacterium]|nr:MAG: hypothetical protein JSW34_11405 [candidate division Zixibacteria bacterium]